MVRQWGFPSDSTLPEKVQLPQGLEHGRTGQGLLVQVPTEELWGPEGDQGLCFIGWHRWD